MTSSITSVRETDLIKKTMLDVFTKERTVRTMIMKAEGFEGEFSRLLVSTIKPRFPELDGCFLMKGMKFINKYQLCYPLELISTSTPSFILFVGVKTSIFAKDFSISEYINEHQIVITEDFAKKNTVKSILPKFANKARVFNEVCQIISKRALSYQTLLLYNELNTTSVTTDIREYMEEQNQTEKSRFIAVWFDGKNI